MKQRGAYVSKFAAAALLVGVSQSAVLAQSAPPVPETSPTTFITTSTATDPRVPVGIIGGLGGAFVLAGLYGAYRRQRGSLFFTATGAAIITAMANPQMITQEQKQLPTEVVVLVDRSTSQSLGDRTSVTDTTLANLTQKLSAMPGVTIRVNEVGRIAGKPAEETNLVAELETLPPDTGAVFILSDGQTHDSAKSEKISDRVPIHALISGSDKEFDRRLVIEQAPRFGMINESQKIRIRLEDSGAYPDGKKPTPVTISQDGKVLKTIAVTPGAPSDILVTLPKTGLNDFVLETGEVKGEITPLNNRALVSVEGIRPQLKVLIISGHPDQGQRSLHDFFKSDSNVELVHFSALRPPEKQDATPLKELALMPFPVHEIFEKLKTFDLVVLDRYESNGLIHMPYLERIADYVRQGGGLMVISGPEYAGGKSLHQTPLGKILPATPSGKVAETTYKPAVTEKGKRHPVTRPLAGDHGVWHRSISAVSPTGMVTMQANGNNPLMVLNRQDKGRVAMLLSDQSWLWARGHDGGGPYTNLIGNTARWLLRDSDMEEESLRLHVQDNQVIVEQQTMAEKGTPVMLRTPSGKAVPLETKQTGPGLWQATLPADEIGLYSAESNKEQTGKAYTFAGPVNPREYENPVSTTNLLAPLSRKTGGVTMRMTEASGAASDFQLQAHYKQDEVLSAGKFNIRMNTDSIITGSKREPLIPDYVMLATIIGLFGAGLYRHSEMSLKKKSDRKDGPQP